MKKSQTLLKSGNGQKFDKLSEGDLVFTLQCNRTNDAKAEYQLMTNMDWSFDDDVTPIEIKSFLGSFLSSIEEAFGEKMVTEALMHYAKEKGHLVDMAGGKVLNFRSKGLSFKDIKAQRN